MGGKNCKKKTPKEAKIYAFYCNENQGGWMPCLNNIGTITFRSVMGMDKESELSKKYPIGPDGKRLKPCCACPETKRARDTCVIEKGEENCTELIEAHKACMRSLGFNI